MHFMRGNPHVVLTNIGNASVGGLKGVEMDVAYADGDGCPDGDYVDLMVGVDPSHGAFGVSPSEYALRAILLHVPGRDLPLAILIDDARNGGSDYGDGESWLDAAEGVIDTFVITPGTIDQSLVAQRGPATAVSVRGPSAEPSEATPQPSVRPALPRGQGKPLLLTTVDGPAPFRNGPMSMY